MVAEGSIAAVVIERLCGASQTEFLVYVPAAPRDLRVPALFADQHHCAPCTLAGWFLAVWALTSAVHQPTPGGLYHTSWKTREKSSHFLLLSCPFWSQASTQDLVLNATHSLSFSRSRTPATQAVETVRSLLWSTACNRISSPYCRSCSGPGLPLFTPLLPPPKM